jgi:hypothetical protein
MAFKLVPAELIVGQLTSAQIADGAIGTIQLADGSVTAAQIAAAAGILGSQLADATITGGNIAAGTITASLLAAGIVVAGIVDGTLIEAAQFVAYASNGAILVYSGVPGPGNLVGSWSAEAGEDTHGNSYPAGLSVTNGSGQGTLLNSTELVFQGAGEVSPGFLACQASSGGSRPLVIFTSPTDDALTAQVLMYGQASGGTSPLIVIQALDSGTPEAITAQLNGILAATEPGSTGLDNPGTPETWHAMTLENSWAVQSGYQARYKLTPGNAVRVHAELTAGTLTSGTTIWTAPTGYIPSQEQEFPVTIQTGPAAAPATQPYVHMGTGGALDIENAPSTLADCILDLEYALD